MKVNIKTISDITGFSQSTISNVLNNKKGVNNNTAETIFRVAREIGYISSSHITSIKVVMYKKSGNILTNTPLISAVLEGVENEGHIHGLNTIIYNIGKDDVQFQSKLDSITRERNSGIILLATELDWTDMKPFLNVSIPMVVLDAWFKEGHFDSILMDNTGSLYLSVSCLVKKGHTKIGFINSAIPILNFVYRRNGFNAAMKEYNLAVEEKFCFDLAPTSNGAYEDMCRFLEKKPELPSAFCIVNDIIAFGVMKALQEYGYSIPDDISIVGFDNMPFSEITSPPLTTIDVPKRELGEIAVRRLIEKTANKTEIPSTIQLLTSLVERKTVKQI
jgi:LacI family transcriptional regulator